MQRQRVAPCGERRIVKQIASSSGVLLNGDDASDDDASTTNCDATCRQPRVKCVAHPLRRPLLLDLHLQRRRCVVVLRQVTVKVARRRREARPNHTTPTFRRCRNETNRRIWWARVRKPRLSWRSSGSENHATIPGQQRTHRLKGSQREAGQLEAIKVMRATESISNACCVDEAETLIVRKA